MASLGRCGTTLLYYAISAKVRNKRMHVSALDEASFDNTLIGTHGYPLKTAPAQPTKAIFLFGDIVDTVLSTTASINSWGRRHYAHTQTSQAFRPNEDLYTADLLELERLFDAWYRPQVVDLLTLRYETLYDPDSLERLEEFLGVRVRLPPYRKRTTDAASHPAAAEIRRVYQDLDAKIKAAADARIWPAAADHRSR